MRTLLPSRFFRAGYDAISRSSPSRLFAPAAITTAAPCDPVACAQQCRCFAHIKETECVFPDVSFTSSTPRNTGSTQEKDYKPPDERTLRLGKTVRTLHERLPTLLLSPLPSEILSPQISLHLFPSTLPHLPTVSGRIAYVAALWTAPVAWGRVPLIGNVKLSILSERMVRDCSVGRTPSSQGERLIVKWKTCGNSKQVDPPGGLYRGDGMGAKERVEKIKDFITGMAQTGNGTSRQARSDEEFCGIFVFEFDESGRIAKHVIEHTEEGGHYDKMARVVSVTDWLLGQFNGKGKEHVPALAWCEERPHGTGVRIVDRSRRLH